MVNRIVSEAIVVASDHCDRATEARKLITCKIQAGLLHPIVIEQIARQQKQIYIVFYGCIDDSNKSCLTTTRLFPLAYSIVEMNIRSVQQPEFAFQLNSLRNYLPDMAINQQPTVRRKLPPQESHLVSENTTTM